MRNVSDSESSYIFDFLGLDQLAATRVFKKLMVRLGHEQFYAQGGDWGANIVTLMAQAYPQWAPTYQQDQLQTLHFIRRIKIAISN